MSTENESSPATIKLHCLAGQPAPAELLEGWKRFAAIPADALDDFRTHFGQLLENPAAPVHRQRLEEFFQRREIPLQEGISATQACELLLGRAAALDLDVEYFRQDLAALSGGPCHATELLLSQYAAVKAQLRKRIILETLSDHGKLLVGINWRVDTVTASERGVQINTPVVFLTLLYRESDKLDQITLQLTPEAVKDLQRFCGRFEN